MSDGSDRGGRQDRAPVVVSRAPDELAAVRDWDVPIELKFDWEHDSLLRGDRSLADYLETVGVDPGRIASVHLPPGLGRGSDVEMALTERNRGRIVSFVHEQLEAVPDARLVAHPPKRFEYVELLELIATVTDLTDREFAVENAAVDSGWYEPAAIAFFGYAGEQYDRLRGLSLTIDTAHLPARDGRTAVGPLDPLDPAALEDVATSLEGSGFDLPSEFEATLQRRADAMETVLPDDVDTSVLETAPYAPALRTLCLAGPATAELHLNDPVTDCVPDPDGHAERPLFGAVLECALDHGVDIVLEPNELGDETLAERVDAIRHAIDPTRDVSCDFRWTRFRR